MSRTTTLFTLSARHYDMGNSCNAFAKIGNISESNKKKGEKFLKYSSEGVK